MVTPDRCEAEHTMLRELRSIGKIVPASYCGWKECDCGTLEGGAALVACRGGSSGVTQLLNAVCSRSAPRQDIPSKVAAVGRGVRHVFYRSVNMAWQPDPDVGRRTGPDLHGFCGPSCF